MNKEPFSLYIFRFLLAAGLFVLMTMLYWSSVLIEGDLKGFKSDLNQIKNELQGLKEEIGTIQVLRADGTRGKNGEEANHLSQESQFPNLLEEDLFYNETLPKLLGRSFKPHGIRKEATIGRPDNLHPFTNFAQMAAWISACTVSIASQKFGIYETLSPDMAYRMELRHNEKGHPEYWIFLRKNVFWQPLNQSHFSEGIVLAPHFLHPHKVTAHDFKFFLDVMMNPHVQEAQAVALRNYFQDIEEIKVVDDFTLVVRWKTEDVQRNGKTIPLMKYSSKAWTGSLRPLASFVYQYFPDGTKIIPDDSDPNTYRTNSVWAKNFSHHWAKNVIVSCGPWLFNGMTDSEIRFKRNPHYFLPYAVLTEELEVKFKDSPDGIWESFRAGSLDLFQIPPNQLAELENFLMSSAYQSQKNRDLGIKRLDYVDRSYSYIGWNQTRPFFKSKKVRQALTMAIDRERIIRQNLNGMGVETTGTFFRYSPSYNPDIIPLPYDPQKARRLLEEEGWYDSDGDGIIDKLIDGERVPFKFALTYYVKNQTTKSICEYVSTALKELGISCTLNGVDLADLSAIFDEKNFDALFLAWALGTPPEDPKQIWYSAGATEKGSSNSIGFSNKEIDAIINQLEYEYDYEKRLELYHRFDEILYDEMPYTFLFTPKAVLIYREYLQNVFLPVDRQDLVPGANVAEPQSNIFWIKE